MWLVRLWVALALVKTLMGYYQMPMMIRVLRKTSHRDLTRFEIAQMIALSPLVNLFAMPVYLFKEKIYFFQPYEESYVEKRFSEM